MKLINDDENFKSEYLKEIYFIKGNCIYCKKINDKKYKLFKKFKNATKAKRYFHNFILDKSVTQMGRYYMVNG